MLRIPKENYEKRLNDFQSDLEGTHGDLAKGIESAIRSTRITFTLCEQLCKGLTNFENVSGLLKIKTQQSHIDDFNKIKESYTSMLRATNLTKVLQDDLVKSGEAALQHIKDTLHISTTAIDVAGSVAEKSISLMIKSIDLYVWAPNWQEFSFNAFSETLQEVTDSIPIVHWYNFLQRLFNYRKDWLEGAKKYQDYLERYLCATNLWAESSQTILMFYIHQVAEDLKRLKNKEA